MKNLIKAAGLMIFSLALANCGGGGGGGSSAPAPVVNQVTEGATDVEFDARGVTVKWSQSLNNIYMDLTNSSCIQGLKTNADDNVISQRISTLRDLINTSTVGLGTLDVADTANSTYLHVQYSDGSRRSYNLNADLAGKNEETLSRGAEIIAFFNQAASDINSYGVQTCPTGKDKGIKY